MIKKLFVISLLALTGCSTTVPVTAKFPKPPEKSGAMVACPQLQSLEADPKISDVSKTINLNYGTYYECAVKLDTWIEWYHAQKLIFESVK